jgi:cysteine-rich repeat protein
VSSTSVPSTSVPTTSTTSTTIFAVPVVPYTRYDATGPDGPVVMVDDEFASTLVDLGTVVLELPPVTIDGQLPPDPFTHQTCYAHPGGLLDDCVDIQDRFGFAPLRIGNPVGVCIPELFPSIAVDAFACYQAVGTALELNVTLDDEFQSQAVTIGVPELFCTPAEIDGDPLQNAARYLVCYATTPTGAAGGQIMVENALHPGPIQVDVGIATGLCVPAVRQLVPSCDLCGNGVTDAGAGEECDDGNVTGGDGCSAVCRTEGP